MQVEIGRRGNQSFPITELSVSSHHATLIKDESTGKITLRDNNSTNGTYVLANDGRFRRITTPTTVGMDTIVKFGETVTFRVRELLPNIDPPTTGGVDISKLRYVQSNYQHNKMDIEAQMNNIMMLRIAAMSISAMVGGAITQILPKGTFGEGAESAIIKVLIVVILMVLSLLLVSIKNKSLLHRRYQNEEMYKQKYRCPKCGYSFGTRIFENLVAEGKCPNPSCKCKFTAKK